MALFQFIGTGNFSPASKLGDSAKTSNLLGGGSSTQKLGLGEFIKNLPDTVGKVKDIVSAFQKNPTVNVPLEADNEALKQKQNFQKKMVYISIAGFFFLFFFLFGFKKRK